jgi:hypothetical protein
VSEERNMSATKTTTAPKINVRTWSGSQTVLVTEMTNAGKRGKTCRTIHAGFRGRVGDDAAGYGEWLHAINDVLPHLDAAETSFDDAATYLRAMSGVAQIELREETIRGVDAPLPALVVKGTTWDASADETGVHVADYLDRNNEPRSLSRGSHARSYKLAAKVFPTLTPEMRYHDVVQALEAAGIDLHSYCAMD